MVVQVKSRDGFQGCLASIDLDGSDSRSILEQGAEIPYDYQEQIKEGCEGMSPLASSFCLTCA